jgi:hypothetical protein
MQPAGGRGGRGGEGCGGTALPAAARHSDGPRQRPAAPAAQPRPHLRPVQEYTSLKVVKIEHDANKGLIEQYKVCLCRCRCAPPMPWAAPRYPRPAPAPPRPAPPRLARRLAQVYGLPALILFKDGKQVEGSHREGAVSKPMLQAYLTKHGITASASVSS